MGNLPGSVASLVCHLFFLVSHSVCLHSSFFLGPRQKDSTSESFYTGFKQKNMCQKQRIPPSVNLVVYNVEQCIVTETLRFWLTRCNWILLYDLFSGRLSVRSDKSALQFVKCVACRVMAWRAYTTLSLLDSMVWEGVKDAKTKPKRKSKWERWGYMSGAGGYQKKASEHMWKSQKWELEFCLKTETDWDRERGIKEWEGRKKWENDWVK